MRLRYAGPGPHDDGRGGLVRPGDIWDWPEEPPWGPWEPVPDEDGGQEPSGAAESSVPSPAPAPEPEKPGAAISAAAAADTEGS